ncbi:MAG TPA: DUF2784 domain-containing protein [Sediminispirochaeta sp.]|nr:DUF2784 domain-containing protein [Sediminispirochaeta sp.]
MFSNPSFYADVVVIIHFLYLFFTVGGQAAILFGAALKWVWVRNRVFRVVHLLAVLIVAFQELIGVLCPLTRLEYALRRSAGASPEEISFVGRLVRRLLYYDFPPWVFTALYLGFGGIVILTWFLVRPKRRASISGRSRREKFNRS